MWEGINLALDQTKHKKTVPMTVKDINGIPQDKSEKIANAFADYFQTVPEKTKSKIKPSKRHYLDYLNKCNKIDNYLVLKDTNVEEI